MTQPQAQCGACDRYRSPFSAENTTGLEGPFCAAFPTGIPDRIFHNEVDHRQPVEGDHGLQWIPRDGAVFPTYAFPAGVLTAALTAAAVPVSGSYTGAMVALIPADDDATDLLFLGDAVDLDDQTRADIVDQCRAVAAGWDPVEADGFAISMFNPHGDDPCVVLGLSGTDLAAFYDEVSEVVDASAEQHRPWIPHVTLAYTDDVGLVPELTDRCGVVVFDRLRVAYGGEHIDIPLGESPDLEVEDDAPGAPPVPVMAAARTVWTGCPYCFRDAHEGSCS